MDKKLHKPGIEPGTPAVLRRCHNQLDQLRLLDGMAFNFFFNSSVTFLTIFSCRDDQHSGLEPIIRIWCIEKGELNVRSALSKNCRY